MEENRNPRPVDETSKLPTITLFVLIAMVIALLFVGWQSMKDDGVKEDELVSKRPNSIAVSGQNGADAVVIPPPLEETGEDIVAKDEKKKEPNKIEVNKKKEKPKEEPKKIENDKKKEKPKEEPKKIEVNKKKEKPKEGLKKIETDQKKEKPKEEPKKIENDKKKEEPKTIKIPEGETISHTVQSGETFYGIANRYHISKATLQALNPGVSQGGIKVGVTKLNVKIQTIHMVGPGDVLRVVAHKYGISKQSLMNANKKTKDLAERGEKLIIPLK